MNVWYTKNNRMGIPTKHRILYLLCYVNGLTSSQHVKDVTHTHTHTQTPLNTYSPQPTLTHVTDTLNKLL